MRYSGGNHTVHRRCTTGISSVGKTGSRTASRPGSSPAVEYPRRSVAWLWPEGSSTVHPAPSFGSCVGDSGCEPIENDAGRTSPGSATCKRRRPPVSMRIVASWAVTPSAAKPRVQIDRPGPSSGLGLNRLRWRDTDDRLVSQVISRGLVVVGRAGPFDSDRRPKVRRAPTSGRDS